MRGKKWPVLFIGIAAKILNKILVNLVQEHLKIISWVFLFPKSVQLRTGAVEEGVGLQFEWGLQSRSRCSLNGVFRVGLVDKATVSKGSTEMVKKSSRWGGVGKGPDAGEGLESSRNNEKSNAATLEGGKVRVNFGEERETQLVGLVTAVKTSGVNLKWDAVTKFL